MCTTTLHLRLDEDLKNQASRVYEQLGLDLPTAIRIFLKRSIAVDGMPFELKNKAKQMELSPCAWSVEELHHQVELALDDIKNNRLYSLDEVETHFKNRRYGSRMD